MVERAIARRRASPNCARHWRRNIGGDRNIELTGDNIVVQPGGKPVITKFIQAVMNPGDGVLYPNPGYPIYESQINYFGGTPLPYRYHEMPTGFGIDLDQLRQLAPQARLLIYNNLQNPLGCESSPEEMAEIARLAVEHDLTVLSDEAYFEMRYSVPPRRSPRCRDGRANRDPLHLLQEVRDDGLAAGMCCGSGTRRSLQIAKINTNDESCTTHFVQAAGVEALRDPSGAAALLAELRRRRDAAVDALAAVPGLVCAKPESTFYLLPNVTEAVGRVGLDSVSITAALHHTGVSFCTRHHFGTAQPGETEHYIQFLLGDRCRRHHRGHR